MKKIVLVAFAISAMLPQVSFAAANPNSNGVNKNCFGQGRSGYSSNPTAGSTGSIISDRAQDNTVGAGDGNPVDGGATLQAGYPNLNVQLNDQYKTACQGS